MRIVPVTAGYAPTINLFPAVTNENAEIAYLRDTTNAVKQAQETKIATVGNEWTNLTQHLDFSTWDGNAHFLFEGKTIGRGELQARVRCGDMILAEDAISIELRKASQFAETYRVGVLTGMTWDTIVESSYCQETNFAAWAETQDPVSCPWNGGDDIVLFVHGWNMSQSEKDSWTDTVVKRLYWTGYLGRTVSFQWPTLDGFSGLLSALSDSQHFDNSEFRAWQSGSPFAELMEALSARGQVTILAHSMGNVVALEGLKKYNGAIVRNYIALQGALGAEFWQGGIYLENASNCCEASWADLSFPDTPNIMGFFALGQPPSQPYSASIQSKVANFANFFNYEDYALKKWEICNRMKPDQYVGYNFGYFPSSEPDAPYVDLSDQTYFNRGTNRLSVYVDIQRYQIFSYAAQCRSKALGQLNVTGFAPSDLNYLFGFNGAHYSHSREFRSDIVRELPFWGRIRDLMR